MTKRCCAAFGRLPKESWHGMDYVQESWLYKRMRMAICENHITDDRQDKRISQAAASYYLTAVINSAIKTAFPMSDTLWTLISLLFAAVIAFFLLRVIFVLLQRTAAVFVLVSFLIVLAYAVSYFMGYVGSRTLLSGLVSSYVICFLIALCVFAVNDREILYRVFCQASYIAVPAAVAGFFLMGTKGSYSMGLAYSVILFVMIQWNEAVKKKKVLNFALALLGTAAVLLRGNRGALLCILIFVVVRLFMALGSLKQRIWLLAGLGVLAALALLFGQRIAEWLIQLMSQYGLSSYTLGRIATGNLLADSGRGVLSDYYWELIPQRPLLGYGVMGAYMGDGLYPHNIVTEAFLAFGYIGGGVFLCLFFASMLKVVVFRKRQKELGDLFLPAFACAFSLFLSGTFLTWPWFWLLLATAWSESGIEKIKPIKRLQDFLVSLIDRLKHKAVQNILLNVIAAALPLIVLQFLVLPRVNSGIGAEKYGLAVTLISLFSLIPACMGNVLNNVRLLMDMDYRDEQIEGDFNPLALMLAIGGAALTAAITAAYTSLQSWQDVLYMACGALAVFAYGYYSVGFRLSLDYKRMLIANVLLALGHALGYWAFLRSGTWQFIYIFGYALSSLYIIWRSGLARERWHFTRLAKATSFKYMVLFASALIGCIVIYVDRLILYPLLGGTMVAIYYAATLLGKLISAGMVPITTVMLSYFSKMRAMRKNLMGRILLAGLIVGAVGYVVCILVSRPLLTYLYPDIADQSMRYVYITALTSIAGMMCSIVDPAVLRFCDAKWQLLLAGADLILYFACSLSLLRVYGLMGFCLGALIAMTLKLLLLLFIYRKASRQEIADDGGGNPEQEFNEERP